MEVNKEDDLEAVCELVEAVTEMALNEGVEELVAVEVVAHAEVAANYGLAEGVTVGDGMWEDVTGVEYLWEEGLEVEC